MKPFFLLCAALILCFCTHCCYQSVPLELTVIPDPSSQSEICDCPESADGETFDAYVKSWNKRIDDDDDDQDNNVTITLKFLCGKHKLQNSSKATINMRNIRNLTILGDGNDPKIVVMHNMYLIFQDVPALHLANITIRNVSFQLYSKKSELKNRFFFNIQNCIFIQSDCLIVGSNLILQDSSIINGSNTAFNLVSSTLTLAGSVTFSGNSGERGGALGLTATNMSISKDANITFYHNHATDKGGAIYMNNPTEIFKVFPDSNCFYYLLDYDDNATYSVSFVSNYAPYGGNHVFGLSLKSSCTAAVDESKSERVPSHKIISSKTVFHFEEPGLSDMPFDSPVSANPARVCICDETGTPQCLNQSKTFMLTNVHRYPGELFNISLSLVGGDFGSTAGPVKVYLINTQPNSNQQGYISCRDRGDTKKERECFKLLSKKIKKCNQLEYAIYSSNHSELVAMTTVKSNPIRYPSPAYQQAIEAAIKKYTNAEVIEDILMFSPVFINITLKPCPLGFSFKHNAMNCSCYPKLQELAGLTCRLLNDGGYLSHAQKVWIGVKEKEVILSRADFCPFCNNTLSKQQVNLENVTSIDAQCDFNRAGRLCGGCKENYSLAIGSSRCIMCSNNNYLALLIFFAAASVFLIAFITSLNITVTQGMINGVIFYANIIWVYENITFPPNSSGILLFLRIFIAWLNLDFGIETCFVVGLNPFWKTLLQYIFPLYVWSLVGVVIFGAKYSTKLTKLLGSQTVPVLSTLMLLSYMKLVRNAINSLAFAHLDYYNSEGNVRTVVVWNADGTLDYCEIPHVFIFAIALFVVCLCLPYILMLLFGRWLRNVSYLTKFHPIFDSYFTSVKDKHHYWPGLLLLVRAFLYLVKISMFDHQAVLALLITIVLLLCFMSYMQPHKNRFISLLYSVFLVNLVIFSGSILFIYSTSKASQLSYIFSATTVSTAAAFIEFCVIVIASIVRRIPYKWFRKSIRKMKYQTTLRRTHKDHITENASTCYVRLRESILEDHQ